MSSVMFIIVLFLIAKNWKQTKISLSWEVDKLWHKCTMDTVQPSKDRPLVQVATQVNLRCSLQSQTRQTQKTICCSMLLISPLTKA